MEPEILKKIREQLHDFEKGQQDPHLLVIGSTGVGKSSLINAVFGQKLQAVNTVASTTRHFSSHPYQLDADTRVVITDSPGYGEAGHDEEYRREVVREAQQAHVVAVVLKADEKGYARDLDVVRGAASDASFNIEKPLLIALNQIDKVKPSREWSPPYALDAPVHDSDSEKLKNMKEKLALVREQFRGVLGARRMVVVPTMADADEGESFGIEQFKLAIFEALPEAAKFRFIRGSKMAEKASAEVLAKLDEVADQIILAAAGSAAAAVAINPIPASDFLALSGIQVGMVIKLGAVYGKSMSYGSAVEALTTMGAGFAARSLFQGVISVVPIPGVKQFMGSAYAAAATHGMGRVAKAFFRSNTIPGLADLKRIVEEEMRRRDTE